MQQEQDFARFYEENAEKLWRHAVRLATGDRSLAEDVVQDTYVLIVQKWSELESYPPERLRGWAYITMKHKVTDRYRRARRERPDTLLDEPPADQDRAEATTRMAESVADLLPLLDRLPPVQREIMALSVDGYTFAEIAQLLDKRAVTVRSNLRLARQKLRQLQAAAADESHEAARHQPASTLDQLIAAANKTAPARGGNSRDKSDVLLDSVVLVDLAFRPNANDKEARDDFVQRYAPLMWEICRRTGVPSSSIDEVGRRVWARLDEESPALEPAAITAWIAQMTQAECVRMKETPGAGSDSSANAGNQLGDTPTSLVRPEFAAELRHRLGIAARINRELEEAATDEVERVWLCMLFRMMRGYVNREDRRSAIWPIDIWACEKSHVDGVLRAEGTESTYVELSTDIRRVLTIAERVAGRVWVNSAILHPLRTFNRADGEDSS